MKAGVDSAYPPDDRSIAAAASAGITNWAGYFAGPKILNGWSLSDFHRVQAAGLTTHAYCSGWSDPLAMRAQGLSWDIPICLDVEGRIRGDGPWVQGWLDASGAGLYGNLDVHHHTAPFHILADYPGYDPKATWPSNAPKPPTACGWQWQGTHQQYGHAVDSAWLDDDLFGDAGGVIIAASHNASRGESSMVLVGYGPNVRRDGFLIGTDGNLYHLSAPDDISFRSNPTLKGITLNPHAAAGSLAADWNQPKTAFVITYADATGQVYHGLVDDTGVVAGWQFSKVPNAKELLAGATALPPHKHALTINSTTGDVEP
jgi:hypothetical protein